MVFESFCSNQQNIESTQALITNT